MNSVYSAPPLKIVRTRPRLLAAASIDDRCQTGSPPVMIVKAPIRDGRTERQHSAEGDYGSKALWLAPEFGILACEPRMTRGHSKVSGFAPKVWPGGRRCVGKYAVSGRILWIRWALRDRLLVGGGLG